MSLPGFPDKISRRPGSCVCFDRSVDFSRSRRADLGGFELLGLPVGEGDAGSIDDRPGWIQVRVPGGVHEALIAAGSIEHPFRDAHEHDATWVQECEWWYRAAVVVPSVGADERVWIDLDGLDGVADVYWNGLHLGRHENQFRPASYEITTGVRPDNMLHVRFTPPLLGRDTPPSVADMLSRLSLGMAALQPGAVERADGTGTDRRSSLSRATTLRKASFSWGWDFAPNVPSMGLWKPVSIRTQHGPTISAWHVAVDSLADDLSSATVSLLVEVADSQLTDLEATVWLTAPDGRSSSATLTISDGAAWGVMVLDQPQLWWTHDLGPRSRYSVVITLGPASEPIDVVRDTIGLRLVTIDRSEVAEGRRLFQLVLNHRPIFARGACWVPASTLVGSVDPVVVEDLLSRAAEAGFSMIRIWGGGVYESDEFFAACDELGILVWQDFMFCGIDYPSVAPDLLAEISLEAAYQVRRVRNHASMALWGGNNEVQLVHEFAYGEVTPGPWGWSIFHEILPRAVTSHAPSTPYWPGSPWGESTSVNDGADGDRHSWEVWHGLDLGGPQPPAGTALGDIRHYRRYAEETAAFVSEFGIASDPSLSTLATWLSADRLELGSPVLDAHVKDQPAHKVDALLEVTTGLPTTLPQRIAFTQAVQAEGLCFGIECFRRRAPQTAGALIWQFNDSWPGFSWSLLDFEGMPKAAYYAVRRAFSSLAVSVEVAGSDEVTVWVVNDTAEDREIEASIEIGRFSSGPEASHAVSGRVESGRSRQLWTGRMATDEERYVWVSSPSGQFPIARRYWCEIGGLPPGGKLQVEHLDGAVRVSAETFTYGVMLQAPDPRVRFSDNYFDLRRGEERVIRVAGGDAELVRVTSFPD